MLKLYNSEFEQIDEKEVSSPLSSILDFSVQIDERGVVYHNQVYPLEEKIIDCVYVNHELMVMTAFSIYYLDRK
jgi:hypothetical protein